MDRRRTWVPAFFALLPVVALWPALAGRGTIGPWDRIGGMIPGGTPTDRPWDVLQVDACLQFAAWRDLVFASWRAGEVPFWNPYQFAGAPLLANSQSGALYPPHIVLGIVGLSTPIAIVVLAWLHLAWAGLGAARLAERLGAELVGAVAAGAMFALSPFMIGWTALPSVISTVAWAPWAMLAAHRVATERRWGPGVAGLAGCFAMALLAGHLQFAFYVAIGVLCVGVAAEPRRTIPIVLGLALGATIAAPQLIPVLAAGQNSHRRGAPTPQGYARYLAPTRSLAPFAWLGQATAPTARGVPFDSLPGLEGAAGYWPSIVVRGANFAEDAVGLGPLAIGLLALLRRKDLARRAGLGIALAGGIALLLALGSPLNALLYFGAPGWSATGSPGRALMLAVLAGAVLAGLALRSADRTRSLLGIVLIMIGLAVAWLGSIRVGPSDFGLSSDQLAGVTKEVFARQAPLLVLAALAAAGGIASLAWPVAARWRGFALVGLAVAIPAALYATRLVPFSPWPDLSRVSPAPIGARVAIENEKWGLLLAEEALMPPNLATLARVPELSGYDSLIHVRSKNLLDQANGRDSAPAANGNILFVKPGASRERLREAGVSEIWRRGPSGIERERIGGRLVDGPAEFVRRDFGGITLRATGAGPVIVRERFFPGWSARALGRSIPLRPEGPWIRFEARGQGLVKLRYAPPGFGPGLGLAAAALSLAFILAISRARAI